MEVLLGNSTAKEGYRDTPDGPLKFRTVRGNHVTTVRPPDGMSIGEVFTSITNVPNGVWAAHADDPPDWVESDSDGLASLIAEHYGCPVGRPKSWKETV